MTEHTKRVLRLIAGIIFIIVGIVGIVVPIIPGLILLFIGFELLGFGLVIRALVKRYTNYDIPEMSGRGWRWKR